MPNGGAFTWSPEFQKLMPGLRERYSYLLKYPKGITPEEREAIISYTLGGVKAGERGRIEAKRKGLSRMGLLGTGAEFEEEEKERRYTAEQVAGVRKGFAVEDIQNRLNALMTTTGGAQSLLATLMQTEQVPEVLSAGRRGEARASLDQLMNYLGLTMGGAGQYLGPYGQGIQTQAGFQTGGGASFLPWLMYLLMPQKGGTTTTLGETPLPPARDLSYI